MSRGRSPTDGCFGQDSPSQPANAHVHPVLLEQNEDEKEGQEEKWGPPLPLPPTHQHRQGQAPRDTAHTSQRRKLRHGM